MRGYAAIVSARFRSLLQYRAAALGGLFTQTFFGLVRIMILRAFYAASSVVAPMSLQAVTGYVWLGQATLLLIPWREDQDVAEQIRTGNVVYELTRPLDLYGLWFARSLAWRTAPVLLRMLPMFVVAMVIVPAIAPGWELAPPPSIAAFAMWIACFAGAVLISSALTALINVTLMWTVTGEGVPMLIATCATMFGGLVIPLPLFPDWIQPVLYALPFAGMLDLPSRVFTGDIAPADATWVLAHQLVWTLALVALGRWLLSRGVRRLVVQGG
ncbi:MAG TPA: ABC-2 family transporter protein [Kofleriaceae bacterium]|nr:ABC-2 family transporter protein [Kofleriaceae bacterium]